VEGANFDVRKHLLEYDDVLNKQRGQIYSQRDRIFVKEDLSEDIAEMLEAEVTKRIDIGLTDEEGPWKLIARKKNASFFACVATLADMFDSS
jgi:preprotein translocase subunit SecA